MNIWVKIFLFLFLYLFTPLIAEARSGCCSWHDGVCGCSGGRQVCCDGSFSPSCTCYSPPPIQPTPIIFPDMTATSNWSPNTNKTFNLSVTLNDSNPSRYSAVLSKCKGCDPGPKIDFYSKNLTFNNIKPGVYYLNVKKEIGGYWSNVSYWTITIPDWYEPSPTAILTPTHTIDTSKNNDKNSDNSLLSWLFWGGLGFGAYKFLKKANT